MKKIILILSALVAVAPGLSAQTPAGDRLSQLEEMVVVAKEKKQEHKHDVFQINPLAHFGYGWHRLDADVYADRFGPSREVFFNTITLGIHPTSWVSLSAGLDLKWDKFKADESYMFAVVDDDITTLDHAFSSMKSCFTTFSLTVPVALKFELGPLGISAGSEFIFPMKSKTKVRSDYNTLNTDFSAVTKGGQVTKFQYDFFATLSFETIGVFFKYYPKPVLEKAPFPETHYTLGIYLDLN